MSLYATVAVKSTKSRPSGFTLIELVMVIVIIGILSAVGVFLTANSGNYATLLARDQFVSAGLLAQKRALANTDPANAVTLTLEQDADQWRYLISQGTTDFTPRTADRKNNQLQIDGAAAVNSQSFTFDRRGRVGSNIQLSFSGNGSSHLACLSSTGFAFTGSC
jgi:MSHA pilin protein MshC